MSSFVVATESEGEIVVVSKRRGARMGDIDSPRPQQAFGTYESATEFARSYTESTGNDSCVYELRPCATVTTERRVAVVASTKEG